MLKGILAISGEPGLYKMVSQTKTGIIVESLETKKRIPTYSASKISALEDIAIFTYGEEVALKEVFKSIKKISGENEIPTHKSDVKDIKDCFKNALPEYDEDRVYMSDMKKVFRWYHILDQQNMLEETEEAKSDENREEANS